MVVVNKYRVIAGTLLLGASFLLVYLTLVWREGLQKPYSDVSLISGGSDYSCVPDEATRLLSSPGLQFLCRSTAHVQQGMTLAQARVNMFTYLTPMVKCADVVRCGSRGYGGWDVCMAGHFKPQPQRCLIYSFGIENEWSFDEKFAQEHNCTVHSFDPTIGLKDHRRESGIMFHNLGISGSNQVNWKGWPLKTLCTIMRDLGHEHMTIDLLKFDVEFSEWSALEAMKREGCLKNIRQMVFEIHMWTDSDPAASILLSRNGFPIKKNRTDEDSVKDYVMMYDRLHDLQDAGFRAWKIECYEYTCFKPRDQPNIRFCPQCDVGYININFVI